MKNDGTSKEEMGKAITALNDSPLCGHRLIVSQAKPKLIALATENQRENHRELSSQRRDHTVRALLFAYESAT